MQNFKIWPIGLAFLLLCGCIQLSASPSLERFKELDKRYVGERPVWALDEAESEAYAAALAPLADAWQRQKSSAQEASDLANWRLSTLAANRSLLRSISSRALVNPTDEDCRETGYLKQAIASSETAIEQLQIALAQAGSLAKALGDTPEGIALDNPTTSMLLEDTVQRLADLKKIEKFACLKQYPN